MRQYKSYSNKIPVLNQAFFLFRNGIAFIIYSFVSIEVNALKKMLIFRRVRKSWIQRRNGKESKHIFMYLLLTLLNPSDHALFSFSDS